MTVFSGETWTYPDAARLGAVRPTVVHHHKPSRVTPLYLICQREYSSYPIMEDNVILMVEEKAVRATERETGRLTERERERKRERREKERGRER